LIWGVVTPHYVHCIVVLFSASTWRHTFLNSIPLLGIPGWVPCSDFSIRIYSDIPYCPF